MQSAAASARRVASSAIRLSGVSEEASPASGAVRRHSPCYIRWVCRCHCTAPPGLRNCNRTGNFSERRTKTQKRLKAGREIAAAGLVWRWQGAWALGIAGSPGRRDRRRLRHELRVRRARCVRPFSTPASGCWRRRRRRRWCWRRGGARGRLAAVVASFCSELAHRAAGEKDTMSVEAPGLGLAKAAKDGTISNNTKQHNTTTTPNCGNVENKTRGKSRPGG